MEKADDTRHAGSPSRLDADKRPEEAIKIQMQRMGR